MIAWLLMAEYFGPRHIILRLDREQRASGTLIPNLHHILLNQQKSEYQFPCMEDGLNPIIKWNKVSQTSMDYSARAWCWLSYHFFVFQQISSRYSSVDKTSLQMRGIRGFLTCFKFVRVWPYMIVTWLLILIAGKKSASRFMMFSQSKHQWYISRLSVPVMSSYATIHKWLLPSRIIILFSFL